MCVSLIWDNRIKDTFRYSWCFHYTQYGSRDFFILAYDDPCCTTWMYKYIYNMNPIHSFRLAHMRSLTREEPKYQPNRRHRWSAMTEQKNKTMDDHWTDLVVRVISVLTTTNQKNRMGTTLWFEWVGLRRSLSSLSCSCTVSTLAF